MKKCRRGLVSKECMSQAPSCILVYMLSVARFKLNCNDLFCVCEGGGGGGAVLISGVQCVYFGNVSKQRGDTNKKSGFCFSFILVMFLNVWYTLVYKHYITVAHRLQLHAIVGTRTWPSSLSLATYTSSYFSSNYAQLLSQVA